MCVKVLHIMLGTSLILLCCLTELHVMLFFHGSIVLKQTREIKIFKDVPLFGSSRRENFLDKNADKNIHLGISDTLLHLCQPDASETTQVGGI